MTDDMIEIPKKIIKGWMQTLQKIIDETEHHKTKEPTP